VGNLLSESRFPKLLKVKGKQEDWMELLEARGVLTVESRCSIRLSHAPVL
jgi:hypothetical protein